MRGLPTTDHPWLNQPDTLAIYNAHDVVTTARIYKDLRRRLEGVGQWEWFRREWWSVMPAVLAMQARGLPIDLGERTKLRRQFRGEVRTIDKWLCERAGQPYVDLWGDDYRKYKGFKPNSDQQVARWLFGGLRDLRPAGTPVEVTKGITLPSLGLRPAGKTEGGAWSVEKDNLARILRDARKMDAPAIPVLLALLHRTRFVKLDEYLDFDVEGDGRVRPTIKMAGTESLRFAYADPPIHSWAKELRSMVAAPDGHTFVKADFSQLEARLAAYLSRDLVDIAIYERQDARPHPHHPDWDIHSRLICDGLALPPDEWLAMGDADRTLHRDAAKNIRYGTFQYGGNPETVASKVVCPCGSYPDVEVGWGRCKPNRLMDLSPALKRRIVDGWRSLHTPFVRWQRTLADQVAASHYLTNALGLRRQFTKPPGDELYREAYAWAISSCASIIKLRALRGLHALGLPVVLDHHDALMVEVPAHEAEAVGQAMAATMGAPVPELLRGDGAPGVSFPVDVGIGQRWGA